MTSCILADQTVFKCHAWVYFECVKSKTEGWVGLLKAYKRTNDRGKQIHLSHILFVEKW